MTRAIQLDDDPPVIEELPEAEKIGVEEEVAAVSADIEYDASCGIYYERDLIVSYIPAVNFVVSGTSFDSISGSYTAEYVPFDPYEGEQKKEPEKTYLRLPTGKRVILLE